MPTDTYSSGVRPDPPRCVECGMAHGWHKLACGFRIVGYRETGEPIRAWQQEIEDAKRREREFETHTYEYHGPPIEVRYPEADDAN